VYSPVVKEPPHFIDLVLNMNRVAVNVQRGYSMRRVLELHVRSWPVRSIRTA